VLEGDYRKGGGGEINLDWAKVGKQIAAARKKENEGKFEDTGFPFKGVKGKAWTQGKGERA